MKTHLFIFVLMFLTVVGSFGQAYSLSQSDIVKGFNLTRLNNIEQSASIKGSPYMLNEYTNSILFAKDGKAYELDLRFNIDNSEFEFMHEGSKYVVPYEIYDSIKYNNDKTFVPIVKSIAVNKTNVKTMELIGKNQNNKLLKEYNIAFLEAKVAGPYSDALPPRFENRSPDYYLFINGKGIISLSSFKNVEKELNDKSIKNFVKENKLDKRSEKDLISLLNFIGTLNL